MNWITVTVHLIDRAHSAGLTPISVCLLSIIECTVTVILQTLRTAIEDYGEPTPGMLKLPRSISRVVNARRWKEVYLQKAPDPGSPDNTINKRLRDASNQFQLMGLIGRMDVPF
jgi:hypothetical protein